MKLTLSNDDVPEQIPIIAHAFFGSIPFEIIKRIAGPSVSIVRSH
jgi:hypothetical protein